MVTGELTNSIQFDDGAQLEVFDVVDGSIFVWRDQSTLPEVMGRFAGLSIELEEIQVLPIPGTEQDHIHISQLEGLRQLNGNTRLVNLRCFYEHIKFEVEDSKLRTGYVAVYSYNQRNALDSLVRVVRPEDVMRIKIACRMPKRALTLAT